MNCDVNVNANFGFGSGICIMGGYTPRNAVCATGSQNNPNSRVCVNGTYTPVTNNDNCGGYKPKHRPVICKIITC